MSISKESINIAYKQFELDCNIRESRLIGNNIYISPVKVLPGARIIQETDSFFRAISFLGKVYIMTDKAFIPGFEEVLQNKSADWFFEFSNLRLIDRILNEFGREIADTHIFYLPDCNPNISFTSDISKHDKVSSIKKISTANGFELYLKWYDSCHITELKNKPYHNALVYSKTQPDICALEAFDANGNSLGMAGASCDGKYLYQIGIDVAESYRGNGIAKILVSLLKDKMLQEEMMPFYGTSEGHSLSRLTGISAGFLPAFAEIYCKKL